MQRASRQPPHDTESRQMADSVLTDLLTTMSNNLVSLQQMQAGLLTMMDRHFTQLGEVLAHMEANRAAQDLILARIDERLARQDEMLARIDERLARQDEMLARIDEHTTMIAQILGRFEQGHNGQ